MATKLGAAVDVSVFSRTGFADTGRWRCRDGVMPDLCRAEVVSPVAARIYWRRRPGTLRSYRQLCPLPSVTQSAELMYSIRR